MMGSLVCGIFLSLVQHDISFLLVYFLTCQQLHVRRRSNRCSQSSYCMLGCFCDGVLNAALLVSIIATACYIFFIAS
ncbi:hypothetical protein QBC37DRAFT_19396 [Rhypophila decipiens]|uniref:Uncharacterized protein n=1 Tax=Rhypophila decipiens TaxID=261697 RepID=A0AAN6Y333_9PEZI|nr:hypothetical protein QBC37DRAFT_19396 [Rhypophila decipiens]